jgi:hypothetical protein
MAKENLCCSNGKGWGEAGVRWITGLGLILSLLAAAVLELLVMMMAAVIQKDDCRDKLPPGSYPIRPLIADVRGWIWARDRMLSSIATGTICICILVSTVCMAWCSGRRLMFGKASNSKTEP